MNVRVEITGVLLSSSRVGSARMEMKYHVTYSFSLRFNPINSPTRVTSIPPERIFLMSLEASKARIGRRKVESATNANVSTSNR
jgi:hypothetical protein